LLPRSLPPAIAAGLAAFTVYLDVLNNFLRFERYPLLGLEVLYAVLAGGAVSIFFGLAYHLAGYARDLPRRMIRAVLVAGLIAYAAGLVADRTTAIAAGAASLILALWAREKMLSPLLIMSCGVLLAATLGIGQQRELPLVQKSSHKAGVTSLPAIVHIILDEHIGVEGMPPSDPNAARTKQLIRSFYRSHGFKLFGGAYSEHFKTARSIPYVLNFGRSYNAKGSEYFRVLKRRGYRISVIQSEWIDYCSELVEQCTTYQSQNYATVAGSPLTASEKAVLISRKMIPSVLLKAIVGIFLRLQESGYDAKIPVAATDLSPIAMNGLGAIRQLERDVTDLQPGQFYFAHILLPHRPLVLRSDCSVAPIRQWRQAGPGQPLAERLSAYDQQALCSLRAISDVVRAVERSPAGSNAIIIIHGDHGSRIGDVEPMAENMGKFGDDALVAGFSTLFAVRAPGISAGYDTRHFPIGDLVHELARSNFHRTGSLPVARPAVNIMDESLVARRRQPMPNSW
jgi:hypothetical protein